MTVATYESTLPASDGQAVSSDGAAASNPSGRQDNSSQVTTSSNPGVFSYLPLVGADLGLDSTAAGEAFMNLAYGDYGDAVDSVLKATRNNPGAVGDVSKGATFAQQAWKTLGNPSATTQDYINTGLRGAEQFGLGSGTSDLIQTTAPWLTGLAGNDGVGKVLEQNLPGVAGRAAGLSPQNTELAKSLYRDLTSGAFRSPSGGIDLSKVAQYTPLLSDTGLIDSQTHAKVNGILGSLSKGDWVGAGAHLSGVDPQTASALLGVNSTAETRASGALQLAGVNIPPETLNEAFSGHGDVGASLEVLSAVSGRGTVGDVAQGAKFAHDVWQASQNPATTGEDWTSLLTQGADRLNLGDGAKAAIAAAPLIFDEVAGRSEGGTSTGEALGAGADAARALIPGEWGQVVGGGLDVFAGESVDAERLTESGLTAFGVDKELAAIGGDAAHVLAQGVNVSSAAALGGSVLNAAGAPKEVSALATAGAGIAAGGVTGFGAAAIGVGELIGGDTGKAIGKAGAYAVAIAGGPVGWVGGAAMLAMDLLGFDPPRMAKIPTQNGAFTGEGHDGRPAIFSATQNGGADDMKIKVQQLNTEIEQKPEAMREPQPSGADQILEGQTLLNGEWMYGNGKEDSGVRAGIDPELGFVVQKTNDAGEWETTWRADVNPPPGSFVQMSAETGKLEIYAPAETVVPGKSPEEARANAEFVKIWESNNGEPAPEGRENILYLADSGGFGQGQRNQPDNGEDVDWDVAKFTEQSDSGVLGSGIGGSYSAADGGHMVSQAGTTDYETGGDYGYFDDADQLMQQIPRGTMTDIAFQSEDGDDYVLYNLGNNQFDEMTKEDYDARVAEESQAAQTHVATARQDQNARGSAMA